VGELPEQKHFLLKKINIGQSRRKEVVAGLSLSPTPSPRPLGEAASRIKKALTEA